MPLTDARKQELVRTISADIEAFLKQHSGETFCGFGLYLLAHHAKILLCFNTEEYYTARLKYYQEKSDQSSISELRSNMGEWKYQSTHTYNICSPEEAEKIYCEDICEEDDDSSYTNAHRAFMDFATALLRAVCRTSAYRAIPKANTFFPLLTAVDEKLWDYDRLMAGIAKEADEGDDVEDDDEADG